MEKLHPREGLMDNGIHPPLPGFAHINRYWDKSNQTIAAKILPGQYYVTRSEEMIATVLGSCVSACIRDPRTGVGGMNHFMLPTNDSARDNGDSRISEAARYGNHAMELLINDILKNGGRRGHLEIKVFGGGRILLNMTDVGRRNIEFVCDYIRTEKLHLVTSDLGNVYPRKVHYFPQSGRVMVKKLRTLHNNTVITRESDYMQDLMEHPVAGEIDLF